MKYLYVGFGMIMSGIIGISVLMVFQNVTVNNESDYYNLKETMEAAMLESIDWQFYASGGTDDDGKPKIVNGRNIKNGTRCYGPIKIVEEKFVENFTRRFVKNRIGFSQKYDIEFYDIMEYPPKATVVIRDTASSLLMSSDDFGVVNDLTGILETFPTSEEKEEGIGVCDVFN